LFISFSLLKRWDVFAGFQRSDSAVRRAADRPLQPVLDGAVLQLAA
jgi:hypothetical protein